MVQLGGPKVMGANGVSHHIVEDDLAGVACVHLQLWGKAHQLLKLAVVRLDDAGLQTRAWRLLAELAHRQGDETEAAAAWRSAAQVRLSRKS